MWLPSLWGPEACLPLLAGSLIRPLSSWTGLLQVTQDSAHPDWATPCPRWPEEEAQGLRSPEPAPRACPPHAVFPFICLAGITCASNEESNEELLAWDRGRDGNRLRQQQPGGVARLSWSIAGTGRVPQGGTLEPHFRLSGWMKHPCMVLSPPLPLTMPTSGFWFRASAGRGSKGLPLSPLPQILATGKPRPRGDVLGQGQ